jgi:hypothetical protein
VQFSFPYGLPFSVVAIFVSWASSSKVLPTPSGLVGTFRLYMTLPSTSITDDLGLLALGHIMSTHTTVVADDILTRIVVVSRLELFPTSLNLGLKLLSGVGLAAGYFLGLIWALLFLSSCTYL